MVGFRQTNLFILGIVFIVCFIPFMSFADDVCWCGNMMCGVGQYCDEYYNWGEEDPIYSCIGCPTGQVPDASCGGCEYCGPEYTLTCPGDDGSSAWATIKCKVIASDCNGISGCTKYEACNRGNHGNKWFIVSDSCHIESDTCYANERDCKDFPVAGGAISNYTPSNTAYWMGAETGWDVSSCKYNVSDANLFSCQKFNARSVVASENSFVPSVSSSVTYTWTHAFCKKCDAGYLPVIVPSPNAGIITRPDGEPGNWGVSTCTSVTVPNYADGCVIDFSASSDAVLAACTKSCDTGYTILQDGATSESQCTIDSSQIYSDNTGRFTIGAGQCSQ